MERHTNKNNIIETIKVPLQSISKSGRTIFAYMRRSTTKEEQGNSLTQQEERIDYIAKKLGIDLSNIKVYVESRSGFENKSRKEFERMMQDIDNEKEKCIILCRESSRLSRNENDSLRITNRIFGDNKTPKKIECVYFLRGMEVEKWDETGDKESIKTELFENYLFSIRNKKICMQGILAKLEKGELPYRSPHGLSRVNSRGEEKVTRHEKSFLKQNREMPFIQHAFEMKAKGRTAKEICKYLKQYGKISISGKNLVETLFANTVYKGEYTEKTTGTIFSDLKFLEGKPPISNELWDRANEKIGKRGYGFGEGQADHIAPGILKHESGKSLYIYKAKGKYNAYQTEIKGENGKRKSVGIMESKLVKEFLSEAIPKISLIYYSIGEATKKEIAKSAKKVIEEVILEWEEGQKQEKESEITEKIIEVTEEKRKEAIAVASNSIQNLIYRTSKDKFESMLNIDHTVIDTTEANIREFEEKRKMLEEEKKTIDKKAFKLGYSADIANEMKQDLEKEIQEIEAQIDLLSESTNIEEYLDRLPRILLDLHELSSKVQSEADYKGMRNDIKQLMELVSHELVLDNKKELKVKLFEGLESLETLGKSNGATSKARTCDLLLRREAL